MTNRQQYITDLIQTAFRDVTLGDGISLLQAEGMSRFEDCRPKNEFVHWSEIPVSALIDCASSLSYFDAEGMRFYIPAFIIAILEGTLQATDTIFVLYFTEHDNLSRFATLNKLQKHAIREFMLWCLEENEVNGYDKPMFMEALDNFWQED